MAIIRPVTKTIISSLGWGIPITDEVNRLTTVVASLQPTPWAGLTLQNGWTNYGGGYDVASYRKVGDMVQVKGTVRNGTVGQVWATLPVGYRPPLALALVIAGNGINYNVPITNILTDGTMTFYDTGNSAIHVTLQFSLTP